MKYRSFIFECTKEVASSLEKNNTPDLAHLAMCYADCQKNTLNDAYGHASKLSGKMFGVLYQGQLIRESESVNRISFGTGSNCKLLALYDNIKNKSYILNQQGIIEEISGSVYVNKESHLEDAEGNLLSCLPLVDQTVIIDTERNVKIIYYTSSNDIRYLGPDLGIAGIKRIDDFLPVSLKSDATLSLKVTEDNVKILGNEDSVEKWQKESLQEIKLAKPQQLYKDINRTNNVFLREKSNIKRLGIEELNIPDDTEGKKEFIHKTFNISMPYVEKISGLGQTLPNSYIPILKNWFQLSYKDAEISGKNCILKHYSALTQEDPTRYSYEQISTCYVWGHEDRAYILNEKGQLEEVSSDFFNAKIIDVDKNGDATLQSKYKHKDTIIEKIIKIKPFLQIQGKSTLNLLPVENGNLKQDTAVEAIQTTGELEISVTVQTPHVKYSGPEKSAIITYNNLPKSTALEDSFIDVRKSTELDELEDSFIGISQETKGSEKKMGVERLSISQLHATYRQFQQDEVTGNGMLKNATYESSYIPKKTLDTEGKREDVIYYNFSRSSKDLPSVMLFEPVTVGRHEEPGASCLDDVLKAVERSLEGNVRVIVPIAEVVKQGRLYPGHRHYVNLVIDYTERNVVAQVIDSKSAAASGYLGRYLGLNRDTDIHQKLVEHQKTVKIPLTMRSRKYLGIQAMLDNIQCGYYSGNIVKYLLENDRIDLTGKDISADEDHFRSIHALVINEGTPGVIKGVLTSKKSLLKHQVKDEITMELFRFCEILKESKFDLKKPNELNEILQTTKYLYKGFNDIYLPDMENYERIHQNLSSLEEFIKSDHINPDEFLVLSMRIQTLGADLQYVVLSERFGKSIALAILDFNDEDIDFTSFLQKNQMFLDENVLGTFFYEHHQYLNKGKLSDFLSTRDAKLALKHEKILEAFMERLDFSKQSVEIALQQFLREYVQLPEESEKISVIIKAFTKRYHACNPDSNENIDYSLVLTAINKKEFFKNYQEQTSISKKMLFDFYKKTPDLVKLFNVNPRNALKVFSGGKPEEIAEFLKNTKGLDKIRIGEYIGELGASKNKDENEKELAILKSYVSTFDFKGKEFIASLRAFLNAFRLPGEAQKIGRIMESFANEFYKQNVDISEFEFKNADSAYALAFSVITLNTDAHSASIPKNKKMTENEFIKNNKGINDKKDFSEIMLKNIYKEITSNEIKLKEESKGPSLKGIV